VSVLVGDANGAYPSGNTLLVRGAGESVVIDPSVTVVARGGTPVPVDAVINSHSHEDHMAGNGTFPDARLHIHDDDLPGARSIDGLMAVYGLTGDARDEFERVSSTSSTTRRAPTRRASPTATCSTSAAE
jgi:glyoxylase-like metal-dependent hydrolase (beta-lactamase superfamily II)